jgi:hypothetical protein
MKTEVLTGDEMKQTKPRKAQEDRLLKQLTLGERRRQEILRRQIMSEQLYASV